MPMSPMGLCPPWDFWSLKTPKCAKDPGLQEAEWDLLGLGSACCPGSRAWRSRPPEPARRGQHERSERVWLSSGPAPDPGPRGRVSRPCPQLTGPCSHCPSAGGRGWACEGHSSALAAAPGVLESASHSPRATDHCPRHRAAIPAWTLRTQGTLRTPLKPQAPPLTRVAPMAPQSGRESRSARLACLPLWSEASWDLRVQHPESTHKEAGHAAPKGVAGTGGSGGAEVCTAPRDAVGPVVGSPLPPGAAREPAALRQPRAAWTRPSGAGSTARAQGKRRPSPEHPGRLACCPPRVSSLRGHGLARGWAGWGRALREANGGPRSPRKLPLYRHVRGAARGAWDPFGARSSLTRLQHHDEDVPAGRGPPLQRPRPEQAAGGGGCRRHPFRTQESTL